MCKKHTVKSKDQKNISYIEALKVLTPREIEVLELIEKNYTDKEIASILFLSVRTIHSHKRNMHDKIGVIGRGGAEKVD